MVADKLSAWDKVDVRLFPNMAARVTCIIQFSFKNFNLLTSYNTNYQYQINKRQMGGC